jgi:hypothetical protein
MHEAFNEMFRDHSNHIQGKSHILIFYQEEINACTRCEIPEGLPCRLTVCCSGKRACFLRNGQCDTIVGSVPFEMSVDEEKGTAIHKGGTHTFRSYRLHITGVCAWRLRFARSR